MIIHMKRRFPLLLILLVALSGCSSMRTEDADVVREQRQTALRNALSQATDKVPVTLFATTTTATFLTSSSQPLLTMTEIPLLQHYLGTYRTLCQNAFRATLLSMPDEVKGIAQTMGIPDPKAVIDRRDDSMTELLATTAATPLKEAISKHLETELADAQAMLGRILTMYRIWDTGKQHVGEKALPEVSEPTLQAYTDLFFDRYIASLRTQEIDVRTTPRLVGSGSLYEFFAKEKETRK
jgi:hypothetical protein